MAGQRMTQRFAIGALTLLALADLVMSAAPAAAMGLGRGGEGEAAMAEVCTTVRIERFADNPIIGPGMDARMGTNIQGPSLIRVPDWVDDPLGRYYLYFADHKGSYIRLAYADDLAGPWQIYTPGSLQLENSHFLTEPAPIPEDATQILANSLPGSAEREGEGINSRLDDARIPHIASPDVHVDNANQRFVMYFHGLEAFRMQPTRVALSSDGISFEAREPSLGNPYFRAFAHDGMTYSLAMPGIFYRSADGLSDFEQGPTLFEPTMRHSAVMKRGNTLYVFWTRAGDAPERIYLTTIDIAGDWMSWRASEPVEVLRPELEWEGANLPIEPSVRGAVNVPVNQLRDPAIYQEDGRTFLLYTVKGEAGIAIAELFLDC